MQVTTSSCLEDPKNPRARNAVQGTTSSTEQSPAKLPHSEARTEGHVLVVEDNRMNQIVLLGLLKRLGYTVDLVCNGQEAVDRVKTHVYDSILMDCHMPVMDGVEATTHIRELESDGIRHTPVIGVTADNMPGHRETCLNAGMDDYMTKPVNLGELTRLLRKWTKPGE